ncbi:MAG: glutaminase A [Candidatus Hydrogenedentes bacterium]|nr:glutaminase A [Candidatus Hydrogenedentota bacterium]
MSKQDSASAVSALLGGIKSAASPFRTYLKDIHARFKSVDDGSVADYIPELAKADPNWFGIAVTTVSGASFEVGDSQQLFTIQSVSKPFMFGLALEDRGRQTVQKRVGVEPTGDAFNSIIRLEEKSGRPYNPMINAGAIATAGMVQGAHLTERLNRMLDMLRRYAGRKLDVDMAVYTSERSTGHRNRALAHLMLNFDMVDPNIDDTLDLYFQQCSVLVNAHDLAVMGATLANAGINPLTGERAIAAEYVQDVLSVMYSCGMYDYAGEWAYTVGLPAKSGVGGGVVVVVPHTMAIAVFSPLLDHRGNSVRALRVCEAISSDLGLHIMSHSTDRERLNNLLQGAL